MLISKRPLWAVALAALALLWLAATPADAQFFRGRGGSLPVYGPGINPNAPGYNPVNPFQRLPNGMSYQQAFTNTLQQARLVRSFPPWYYGYNPYPAPIITSGPVVNTPGYNPYAYIPAANPYAGVPAPVNTYGAGAPVVDPSNPYAANTYGSGYEANPYAYSYDPYGGQLRGTADVYRAVGTLYKDVETARLMRESALQAQLDTRKKKFDLERYIRENTPTYTEIQAKNAADTLKRIQVGATDGEVQSGRALNVLLKDIGKFSNRGGLGSMPLDEEVLRRLNVSTANGGNLGLLRDDGVFNWPTAMQQVGTEEQREAVENLAKTLYRQASDGNVKANQLRDLQSQLDALHEALRSKVNEIPAPQYLAAKRFLNDFDAAAQALGTRGGAAQQVAFNRFVRGGKAAHEVADYMNSRGLVFAPATPGDEGSYQAMHTALANYDIQLNSGVATAGR